MGVGTIALVALLLACPLMMIFMHRGGHRHGESSDHAPSLEELRRRRDALDAEIASREEDAVRSHEPGPRAGSAAGG